MSACKWNVYKPHKFPKNNHHQTRRILGPQLKGLEEGPEKQILNIRYITTSLYALTGRFRKKKRESN